MNQNDYENLAEDLQEALVREISYIYGAFVPKDAESVLSAMKTDIYLRERDFLGKNLQERIGNRWFSPYDLLKNRLETKINDFYGEFSLSSQTLERLSRYGKRSDVFTKQFQENLEKSKNTTIKTVLREMDAQIMQEQNFTSTLRTMKKVLNRRTNALQKQLEDSALQMERYMVLWDYQDKGCTHYRLLTEGENCEHCTSLHGAKFPISDASVGDTLPPFHPNCDCRFEILNGQGLPVFAIGEKEKKERIQSLDYLQTSLKQVLLGNFAKETNLVGTLGQIAAGLLGLDLPADIRDLTYDVTHWDNTPSHWLQTLLDAAALLPVVGGLKYADEAAEMAKNGIAIAKSVSDLKPQKLIDELANSGLKHTQKDIVAIFKTPEGKLVWLEKGNKSAGLEHILEHAGQFEDIGIGSKDIVDFIIFTLKNGRIIGKQNTRPIYEVVYKGIKQRVAISIGDNGFIVGANPKTMK